MALLPSEISQLKVEFGWNDLTAGAIPYFGIVATFEQIVEPYLNSGLITTSSTTVTASTTPALTELTLAAVSGVNRQGKAVSVGVGDMLVIDVDGQQELVHVQSITDLIVSVRLSLAHTGTYPVTVQGGEMMVRWLLRQLWDVRLRLSKSSSRAGIKKVDEIEFFQGKSGSGTLFDDLLRLQDYYRQELYRVLFGGGDRSLTGNDTGRGGASIRLG
jgi:hypothetical protein